MLEAYRLQRSLGDSGLGELYACTNRAGDDAILELIYRKYVPNLDLEVLRDAAARTHLCSGHPLIPPIIGLVSVDNRPGTLVRAYDGRDVAVLAATVPPPVPAVLEIVAQVADALDHAWNRVENDGKPLHWWHGDVRPQQIIVDARGDLSLQGFGLLEALGGTTPTAVFTAFTYMSPELLLSQKHPRADIYALAITAYELLTSDRTGLGPTAAPGERDHGLAMAGRIEKLRSCAGDATAELFEAMSRWDPNTRLPHAEVVERARAAGGAKAALVAWASATHGALPSLNFTAFDPDPLIGRPASPIAIGPPAPTTGHRFKRAASKGTEPPSLTRLVGGLDAPPSQQAGMLSRTSAIAVGLAIGVGAGAVGLGAMWLAAKLL